ncbi:hypothetical protein PsorP6_014680 [Peronosclerospora sorghi]|uniref:Uncharacterized protein n=1 Tax=Peronosclerospora sorghi TaxID=230839 RepID=A0ACC0VTN7_9STRA|nr:hypothetical protein PsorP6_014680 [Peronosclerospora sorghi]
MYRSNTATPAHRLDPTSIERICGPGLLVYRIAPGFCAVVVFPETCQTYKGANTTESLCWIKRASL